MDIEFSEPSYRGAPAPAQMGGLGALVIKMGLAKTAAQANGVLIGVFVVSVLLIASIWFFARTEPSISPEEYLQSGGPIETTP